MKFLLDHDVPQDIGHLLRHWGHEATALREVLDQASADEEVLAYIRQHGLMIITCNRNHFLALARDTTDLLASSSSFAAAPGRWNAPGFMLCWPKPEKPVSWATSTSPKSRRGAVFGGGHNL